MEESKDEGESMKYLIFIALLFVSCNTVEPEIEPVMLYDEKQVDTNYEKTDFPDGVCCIEYPL